MGVLTAAWTASMCVCCLQPVATWVRGAEGRLSDGGLGGLPFCILGLIQQCMMKSAILAVKFMSLNYGRQAVCCRPSIPTESTES